MINTIFLYAQGVWTVVYANYQGLPPGHVGSVGSEPCSSCVLCLVSKTFMEGFSYLFFAIFCVIILSSIYYFTMNFRPFLT